MNKNIEARPTGSSVRMCAGCNKRAYKNEFIKIVRIKDGSVHIDSDGKLNGRSAYLCKDKKCFERAKKTKRISYILKCEIPVNVYTQLEEMFDE